MQSTMFSRMTPGRDQKYLHILTTGVTIKNRTAISSATAFRSPTSAPLHLKSCQKPVTIAVSISLGFACLYISSKHSYFQLQCALLVYSHSLVMKITRDNSSPIRFWLASERLSWPTRRTCFILPNI